MDKKLNLTNKLDFSDIDLTAPDIVINELLEQLPIETNGLICGKIKPYDGHVTSYTRSGFKSVAEVLGTADTEVDIQNSLGKIGTEVHKFECYLYTPEYEKYHYRMFFTKYGISNYPVTIVLEESIARSIASSYINYIYTCNNRYELEKLIINILTSKRTISVMQELIRINQAKRTSETPEEVSE